MEHRHQGRHRNVVAIAAAAAVVVIVTVVAIGTGHSHTTVITRPAASTPTSSPPSSPHHSATASPTQQITALLPYVLPGPGAENLSVLDYQSLTPTSSSTASDIYAQDFEGPSTAATPRVVVTTEQAPPHALTHYAQTPSEPITVHGLPGYLDTFPTHLQLLWQATSGEVVSLEAIDVEASALETMAAQLTVVAGHPGVTVSGQLPDGLAQVGRGSLDDDGLLSSTATTITETYQQAGCNAILQVVNGQFADADAIAISAGNGRTITVNGHPAVEITWPADQGSGMTTVIWTYQDGAIGLPSTLARLQGTCANIPELAAELHTVDSLTWQHTLHSLGSRGSTITSGQSSSPPTTAPHPAGAVDETFGIAH